MKVLLIDNYDSFTYNLVQYISELGATVEVVRNDALRPEDVPRLCPQAVVISPGPGRPEDAGVTPDIIRSYGGVFPILGVCLGHQAIAWVYGAKVVAAKRLMHGKTSWVAHTKQGLFEGLPSPFQATRYHSLTVDESTLPPELVPTAHTKDEDRELMGLQHREWPLWGVQFHPESVLTKTGHDLLNNFLTLSRRWHAAQKSGPRSGRKSRIMHQKTTAQKRKKRRDTA